MQVKPDDVNMTQSEQDAIDCWAHGIAHLIDAFGQPRAISLMACATGYLIEKTAKTRKRTMEEIIALEP